MNISCKMYVQGFSSDSLLLNICNLVSLCKYKHRHLEYLIQINEDFLQEELLLFC